MRAIRPLIICMLLFIMSFRPLSSHKSPSSSSSSSSLRRRHLQQSGPDDHFCIPKGQTGIVIGQDLHSILNYTEIYGQAFGYMSYFSLATNESAAADGGRGIPGLESANDYGAGLQYVSAMHQRFPSSHLQLGLYLVDSCLDVVTGRLDDGIAFLINYVSTTLADTRVYLRIGYEFDLPANRYDPSEFSAAFRYIVGKFRSNPSYLSVNNVEFVWHSSLPYMTKARGDDLSWFKPWFPGKEYVDWCGISVFDQPYNCQSPFNCFIDSLDTFIGFCDSMDINSMIAESSPFGGILDDRQFYRRRNLAINDNERKMQYLLSGSSREEEEEGGQEEGGGREVEGSSRSGNICSRREFNFFYKDDESHSFEFNEAGVQGSSWSRWFVPVLSIIDRYEIRIWSYIDNDWDSLPMWRKEHAPGVYWGDARIQCYRGTKLHWEREVMLNNRFKWSTSSRHSPLNGKVDFSRTCSPTGSDDDDDRQGGGGDGDGRSSSDNSNSSYVDKKHKKISLDEKIDELRRDDYYKYLTKCFAGRKGYPYWCSFEGITCDIFSVLFVVAVVHYLYKQYNEHHNNHRYVVIH